MPSLENHHSSQYVKLLLLGDAKSGKTTALVSLLEAGYKLRILDFDNLLDSFVFFAKKRCPDKLNNVDFRSLRDKRKMAGNMPVIDGAPKAFADGMKMLDRWKYKDGETEIDLGVPADWGPDTILVLDSLSRFCDAAYDWAEPLVPRGRSGDFDARAVYGNAQDGVENALAMLTSEGFETNVIVIAHGTYLDLPDGTQKIFPQGVGQKLSPKIPQYFPAYVRFKNQAGKRTIQLKSDAMIDLSNPNPAFDKSSLDVENGLAELFEALKGTTPNE